MTNNAFSGEARRPRARGVDNDSFHTEFMCLLVDESLAMVTSVEKDDTCVE